MDILSRVINGTKRGYQRLAVDVGQTGFFEGREFRTFYEIDFVASQKMIVKAECPVDFILQQLELTLDQGSVRMRTIVGASFTGEYNKTLPIIGKNSMTDRAKPYYVNQMTLQADEADGSLSGGTVIDIVRIVAANATAQQQSVGSVRLDERGIASGIYFIELEAIAGTPKGVFRGFWEERP